MQFFFFIYMYMYIYIMMFCITKSTENSCVMSYKHAFYKLQTWAQLHQACKHKNLLSTGKSCLAKTASPNIP